MPTLSSGRALLDARDILRRAGLLPGMRYADFGCGPLGHFVFPASEIVGAEGRVYAVDILRSSIASIESRIRMGGVENVSPVWGDFERQNGVGVESGSVHMASVVNIVPVLLRAEGASEELKRVLRVDGRVLLVDWKMDKTAIGPPIEHRIDPEEADRAMAAHGFDPQTQFDAGPFHWARVFVRG